MDMALTVTFDLSPEVECVLRESTSNLAGFTKEALLVSLYRQQKLSHLALSEALNLDRFQTESLLARHNVTEDLGAVDDYLDDVANLERLRTTRA